MIDNYRELAGMVAEQRPLLIGIDELDKMATPEEARGFLNEMKSLFDQPGVFYLVSISEDALSDFERRGQPIRDVFDSVFSDVLHLDYLTLDESRLLLERRVIGIPPPWPALFHSLAGGLPRELLRVARSASRLAIEDQDRLESVAKNLVAARVRAHEHATAVMGERDLAPDGSQPVLSWLRNLPPIEATQDLDATLSALRQRLDLKRLFEELREGPTSEEARQRLERLTIELAASCYHSLTCLEFFALLTDVRYQAAVAIRGGRCFLEHLSQAHQDLSVAPRLAWETLDSFRTHEGLDLFAYPS